MVWVVYSVLEHDTGDSPVGSETSPFPDVQFSDPRRQWTGSKSRGDMTFDSETKE